MYDIIGDIHGQVERLYKLLAKLGYVETADGWQHPIRKAIFVGDFIDRNDDQLPVLKTVKAMVDAGNALAVMGNHELNAIGWYTEHTEHKGQYLRARNKKNRHQHQAFLSAVGEQSAVHELWINWFKTLPVFLDLGELRIIHACWDEVAINTLKPYLNDSNCLKESYLASFFDEASPAFQAIEVLLKGQELDLPEGIVFYDKEQNERHKVRVRWWLQGEFTWQQLAIAIPDVKVLPDSKTGYLGVGYQQPIPVFIGHYWLTGTPQPLAPYVACVDYSAAKDYGKLVAYCWHGEQQLLAENFIAVQ